jgi:hypothetical protein
MDESDMAQTPIIIVLERPPESSVASMVNEQDKGIQANFKSYHSSSDFQVRDSDLEKSLNQNVKTNP